jgi:hypothetical protein
LILKEKKLLSQRPLPATDVALVAVLKVSGRVNKLTRGAITSPCDLPPVDVK